MICAIHQPNFFPWTGYFDKIERADRFVFLDQVSYSKSSKTMSSWGNRVAVNIAGEKKWIHCPVIREAGVQSIDRVKIDNRIRWREKLLKTLYLNYKKASFFEEVYDYISALINYETDKLSEYNIHAVQSIAGRLNLDCSFVRQSDLHTTEASNALLIEIAQKVSCGQYLCGGGAGGYQDDALFAESAVEIVYQNYKQIPYPQTHQEFVGGLSVLDALFCCGFQGTERLVKKAAAK